jgi:hypothetical protein
MRQVEYRRLSAELVEPRINEKAVLCNSEVMATLGFADERCCIVSMIVASDFAAKTVGNNPGAGATIARFMFATRKNPRAAGKPFEAPFIRFPVHALSPVVVELGSAGCEIRQAS